MDNEVIMNREGITLIELLVVIVIMGVIIALVAIDTDWLMQETRVTEARDNLLAYIENAKLNSISRVPYGIIIATTSYKTVCLKEGNCSTTTTTACCQDSDCPSGESCSFTSSSINFKKDSAQDCPSACSDIANSTVTLPTNVKVRLTSGTEFWFDRKGVPRTTDWNPLGNTFTVWRDKDGDSTLDSDETSKAIVISSRGRIKYE